MRIEQTVQLSSSCQPIAFRKQESLEPRLALKKWVGCTLVSVVRVAL